jgi:murein L,D-transpeptidase YcbB/YkuD
MRRILSLAACVSIAATLAVVGASPAPAQTVADTETKAAPPPATAPQAPAASQTPAGSQAPAEVAPAEATPAEATPTDTAQPAEAQPAPAPAVVEIDPLLAEIRQQLATLKAGRGIVAADRAGAVAFYAERTGAIWMTADGFTARARHAMQEIAKADDWGLSAKSFELPAADLADPSLPALAKAEVKLSLAVLEYARHARGGRLEPLQVSRNFDQKPPLRDPKQVLEAVAATETPGDYLRELHPKHPQFQLLRQALLKLRAGARDDRKNNEAEKLVRLPNGPTLKLGMEHPDVRLLRDRLKLPEAPLGAEELYDREVQEAVADYQRKSGFRPDGVLGPRTRAALNGVGAERATPTFGTDEQRLLVNMERWRWMPEDLGELHVWDNIPEYQLRVVKGGQAIHQSKIIVGKPETQTAIFSATMKYVIFGPEWGVPDSIKIKEILPYLQPSFETGFFGSWGGTDTRILEKHNLRVSYNGRPVDASSIDWNSVDIRKFSFIQPAGRGNVLGAVKFRFPNKHDIYMHDTPQRELFEKSVRMYSHGCIRVHNPGRLAAILLEEDKGWSAARVRDLMDKGADGISNDVTLTKPVPVHITYFTAMAGEDGEVRYFGDIYGHDRRVTAALGGRPMPLEPPSVSTPTAGRQDPREARRKQRPYAQNTNDIFNGLFGN